VLGDDGVLNVKQCDLLAAWVVEANGVKDFALDASTGRIAVLRKDGTVAVKTGLHGGWTEEGGGIEQLDLSGDYVGVVTSNGTAMVKQGALDAA
jgi:hypothetical protein